MDELMELKRAVEVAFAQFLAVPCYATEGNLKESASWYRRKQNQIFNEGKF